MNRAVQHRLPSERMCAIGASGDDADDCADGCAELVAGPAVVTSTSFLVEGG